MTRSADQIFAVLSLDTAIQALAIIPGQESLAIATQNGIYLVERATWKLIWQSALSRANNAVAFSPDGRYLAATADSGRVTIWETDHPEPVRILNLSSGGAGGAAFSPDGRVFAAGFFQTIQTWDTQTWRKSLNLSGHNNTIWRLVYSPDGRYLASASTDQTILLWDLTKIQKDHKPDRVLRSPTYWVRSAVFSPDGRSIAAGSGDGMIYVWEIASGERLFSLRNEQGFIWDVAYSAAGDLLASASDDGSIVLWDARSGEILHKWHCESAVHSLAFDAQGEVMIAGTADGKILAISYP